MGKMTPHEFLINVIGSTVLNIVPFPSAPIAPSGALINLGYSIRLPEFGETVQELIKKKGAKIPDLLLVNDKQRLLVAVECKSDFTFEMEERLLKQIEFYSSEDFKAIWKELFPGLDSFEVWVVTYKALGKRIADFIAQHMKTNNLENTVVLEVEIQEKRELANIQKVFGNHKDDRLNEQMSSNGISSSLPRTELLVDPTLSSGERVFRIGRRILAFMASAYLTEKERIITIEDFRKRYPDAVMTYGELKRCLRYLVTLIHEIGEYNSATGEIILAKRPSLTQIKAKLESIQNMSENNFKIELAKKSKKRIGITGLKLKRFQKSKLDTWLPKQGMLRIYRPPYLTADPEGERRNICSFREIAAAINGESVFSKEGLDFQRKF
jgi:hypothetical protein